MFKKIHNISRNPNRLILRGKKLSIPFTCSPARCIKPSGKAQNRQEMRAKEQLANFEFDLRYVSRFSFLSDI